MARDDSSIIKQTGPTQQSSSPFSEIENISETFSLFTIYLFIYSHAENKKSPKCGQAENKWSILTFPAGDLCLISS